VPDIEKAWLSVDVRDHEPHLALFGGEDGLGIYRRLIPQAKDVLVSGGWLVMEMGFGQGERVQDLMEQMEFKEIERVPDLQGIERIIFGRTK
jgi:release factor glutamine methyltransferase